MESARRSLVVLLVLAGAVAKLRPAGAAAQVPCFFVFGDSLVDNGNNNDIVSLARANYPPYGIDFAGGPTGRFSNGLTTVDVICIRQIDLNKTIRWNSKNAVPGRVPAAGPGFLGWLCLAELRWLLGHAELDKVFAYTSRSRYSHTHGALFALRAAKLLGFDDFIPPFAGASSDQLLTGVNFASAAAGIREETGQQLGARISFSGQIQNYQSAVQQLVNILGDEDSAAAHLSQCIFTVGMGSNDYLNNYFMPAFYNTGSRYTPQQYADALISQYSQLLRIMYNYGARKVALIGVGQVGCSPNELAQQSANGVTCVERINSAVSIFNQKLVGLVDRFRTLPGAHFTYINIDGIFDDILRSPRAHGLKVTNRGCCGVGRNNGQVTCLPFQTPCANRHEYLFWDAFHPTEAANVLVGQRAYSARLPSDVHPVDLQTLARLS